MDKVGAINMPSLQLPVMLEMQKMAAMAGSHIESSAMSPVRADNQLFVQGKEAHSSFSLVFNRAINSVDNLQHVASNQQAAMDMGISDDLTGTMLASQKASVAFSAMVQVRNKLTTALDEVMNTAL
ncbi:flagellar hook-basal body complex protein FliE [Yersinia frederiksenii]|uniref:flagellar hook-basal body complex protein FliE n=1 Tax=Yersinia frederiksenii TaxID=29484 RepID=UPI0005E51229|nr:flagellar hook-basal body complex protein FliE [Yersinia frederiksenii]CNC48887.1 flagellar hook-basal body complex protein FliE [Yersinia frederiksenii]